MRLAEAVLYMSVYSWLLEVIMSLPLGSASPSGKADQRGLVQRKGMIFSFLESASPNNQNGISFVHLASCVQVKSRITLSPWPGSLKSLMTDCLIDWYWLIDWRINFMPSLAMSSDLNVYCTYRFVSVYARMMLIYMWLLPAMHAISLCPLTHYSHASLIYSLLFLQLSNYSSAYAYNATCWSSALYVSILLTTWSHHVTASWVCFPLRSSWPKRLSSEERN